MDIQKMMKQAQVMQKSMEELQARLAETEVEGQAGGGLVNVVITCRGEIRKLDIAAHILNPQDKETIEDLIIAAINLARDNADAVMADETRKMMESVGLPPGTTLPGM